MSYIHAWKAETITLISLVLTLTFIIACGAAAPEQETSPTSAPGVSPVDATQPTATSLPVAEATTAPAAPEVVKPAGTLNVGQKELGSYDGHPKLVVNPALFVSQTIPLGEGLVYSDINREIQPWLAESWSISEDFTTWTFKLRRGVQFHKGYGEMTSEDVAWSYVEGWANNEKHVRYADFNSFWKAEGDSVTTPDDYTVVVNTGTPLAEAVVLENWGLTPGGSANWVASKRQSDEMGEEAASKSPALTGSWEFAEERPAQYWKMRAVENHWKQTPYFAELVFQEIPEESSRIAGFQTGNLDTFLMAFDTIPLVEEVPGAQLLSIPGAIETGVQFYGNYLVQAEAGEAPDAYDSELPWVSASSDVNSPEWDQARKARQALSIAIDRQVLVDTLLGGFGRPTVMRFWSNHEYQLEGRQWEFNPDRAQELLAEAGYPDGFRITLTPSLRGAPAEVEACEAIATMWGDIGVDVNFQRIPYETLRPQIVGKTYAGATCHATGMRVVTVGAQPQLTTEASFNHGATHPWLEEQMPKIAGAVDPQDLDRFEGELGKWLFDHALTNIGLYAIDVVWPVGPRIEEWTEQVKTKDMRNINGYEFIRPRQ
jgi:peptide/nickel transport system substrate-binding protein